MNKIISVCFFIVCLSTSLCAQKPSWYYNLPTPGNETYYYRIGTGIALNYKDAQIEAMADAIFQSSFRMGLTITLEQVREALKSGTTQAIKLPIDAVCWYSEKVKEGEKVYVLCQVAKEDYKNNVKFTQYSCYNVNEDIVKLQKKEQKVLRYEARMKKKELKGEARMKKKELKGAFYNDYKITYIKIGGTVQFFESENYSKYSKFSWNDIDFNPNNPSYGVDLKMGVLSNDSWFGVSLGLSYLVDKEIDHHTLGAYIVMANGTSRLNIEWLGIGFNYNTEFGTSLILPFAINYKKIFLQYKIALYKPLVGEYNDGQRTSAEPNDFGKNAIRSGRENDYLGNDYYYIVPKVNLSHQITFGFVLDWWS